MWQVERDASFDVVTEAEVAKCCQGNVEDSNDAHGDIKSAGEALWLTHLILYRKNLHTHTHTQRSLKPYHMSKSAEY